MSQESLKSEWYQLATEAAPSALLVADERGTLVMANREAERLFGYSPGALLGEAVERLIPDSTRARHPHLRKGFMADPSARRMGAGRDLVARHQDGTEFPVEVGLNPLVTSEGMFVLIAVIDLTERKLMEGRLVAARRAAEDADRAKSAFLANMSHEIRTPLHGILGMSRLLEETATSSDQREFIESIRTSGDVLLSLINQVLDYSRLDAQGLALDVSSFDTHTCLTSALDVVKSQAASKGLELMLDVDPDHAPLVVGDSARIRQVLVNLLANAIKFTAEGEVSLRMTAAPVDSDSVKLQFSVVDTGIGLEPDSIQSLFQPFAQADESTTRRYGGTGLGLSISRQIVTLMNGRIWAESDGVGTGGSAFRFEVVLPRGADGGKVRIARSDSLLTGLRLLGADDNQTNRAILTRLARRWGMEVDLFDSGEALLRSLSAQSRYHVCVLDFAMPDMDGITLASALLDQLGDALPPLVLLSSVDVVLSDQDLRLFRQILSKPVSPEGLYGALTRAIGVTREIPPVAEPEDDRERLLAETHPLRILIAEDNTLNQQVAKRLLQRLGYDCDLVADGEAALEALRRRVYDLVMMDLNMPKMDGLEASARIQRDWEAGKRPRVVAVSARYLTGDQNVLRKAGIDASLSKPFSMEALVEVLRSTPRLEGGHPTIATPDAEEAPGNAVASPEGSEYVQLNLAPLAERLGEGARARAALLRIVGSFVAQAPRQFESLEAAIGRRAAGEASLLAHSLRSSVAHLGGESLTEVFTGLEAAANGEHASEMDRLLQEARSDFVTLVEEATREMTRRE